MSTASSNDTNTTATSISPTKVNPEQAVSLAALILADDNLAIAPEKLQTLLKAAGITEVEPIWTTLFAKALEGKDVKDILTAVDTSGPGAGGEIGPPPFNDCEDVPGNESGGEGIEIASDSEDEVMYTFELFD